MIDKVMVKRFLEMVLSEIILIPDQRVLRTANIVKAKGVISFFVVFCIDALKTYAGVTWPVI